MINSGLWRSLVARSSGGRKVVSSNLASPTIENGMMMIKNTEGVLPSQDIQKLIQNKKVGSLHYEISKSQIQPSSLDLTLGEKAWRIRASFLPGENNTVEDKLKTVAMYELDLNSNTDLEKGSIYIIKLNETLKLPENLDGSAKAKSSSGRVDLFTRLLSDY